MDRVRWGILSTANIGMKKVTPAIQRGVNCEVVAIASRDLARSEAAARELGIPTALGSYEAVLESADVDAVYIPLPNHLHMEWTIAAAEAGKHVLCEKPLALTSGDAQAMVEACASAGVKFMEAFMYRLHPSWVHVRELLAAGAIGDLRTVHTRFSYYNDDPSNIRNQAAAGGGALMDIGCYAVNLSRMVFGGDPTRVSSAVRRDRRFGTDILTSAVLEFGDRFATFTASTQLADDQKVNLVGTEGRIEIEIPFNIPPDRPSRIFVTPTEGDTATITFPVADPYTVQAELFARAVLEDTPVPTPPEDGVANMKVIESIFAAAS